jgi:hypothetical protein
VHINFITRLSLNDNLVIDMTVTIDYLINSSVIKVSLSRVIVVKMSTLLHRNI